MTYKLKLTAHARSRKAAIEFARSVLEIIEGKTFKRKKYADIIMPFGNACIELDITRSLKIPNDP